MGPRALAVALAFVGCASSSDPSSTESDVVATEAEGRAEVEGTIDAAALSVASARVFVGALSERNGAVRGVRVVLSTDADVCGRADVVAAGHRALSIDVQLPEGGHVAAGNYAVGSGASAKVEGRTATCGSKTFVATAGAVTVEEVTPSRLRGAFVLSIGGQEIKGKFDVPPCLAQPPLATRCE